jgi:hypothetical protein
MVTSLPLGDTIQIGDFVTLIVLAIEGNLIRFGVEPSEQGGIDPSVLLEGRAESNLHWWELLSDSETSRSLPQNGRAGNGSGRGGPKHPCPVLTPASQTPHGVLYGPA